MSEERKIHPLQRAWLAGVFEGKAQITQKLNVIRIDSFSEPTLTRFAEAAGVGTVTRHPNSPNQWKYVTNSLDGTRDLILMVLPLLSPNRAKTATDLLRRIERNPTWQKKHAKKAASSVTKPA
ncbi:hypothetical protein [Paracoccus sp. (in: a-proteobacteria)]|uniref:hypothetical protein n=1 Tax=Paracoccus sp. TaxID=267 RepID=UPI0026DFAEC2|nr:hypothetical protein [Paracoccus sp. (in: a-proteobacteria)]MDO5647350.1 hypothetical protein [Paracoccus sp. (in: a-proteobacteria)]